MSEPFFDYISSNRQTVSNNMYGFEDGEKRYSRHEYISLPGVPEPETKIYQAMLGRHSTRNFKDEPLSLEKLSALLRYSIAKDERSSGSKHYPFPSGGAFYPIETYLDIFNVTGLEPSIYHYATTDHSIAKISNRDARKVDELIEDYGFPFESMPHVILHMTMVKSRTIKKYGSLCYVLSLVEAGYRGQNLVLSAAAHNIGVCPMGGGNYEKINNLLGVDGVNEHHIHGVAIGLEASD